MTRAEAERFVRRSFEELPAESQERAAVRALQRPVFAWSHLSTAQLWRLYGACRVVALIDEVHG